MKMEGYYLLEGTTKQLFFRKTNGTAHLAPIDFGSWKSKFSFIKGILLKMFKELCRLAAVVKL
jgi:hypothetical protein